MGLRQNSIVRRTRWCTHELDRIGVRARLLRRRAAILQARLARDARHHEVLRVPSAAGARPAKVPVLYYLSGLTCTEETFPIKGHAQQAAGAARAHAGRARHEPARAALAGRCRQLGFRPGRGLLSGCHAGAVVDELPDVQLRDARAAGDRGGKLARGRGRDGNFRPLDGRPRRAHRARCSNPSIVQIGVGVLADRGADAMPLGQEGVHQLPRAGHARPGASTMPASWWRASPFRA